MASYMEKKITCPCCGKEFVTRILRGFSQNGPKGMDTNPHHPAIYDLVVVCPHCRYVTERLYENAKEEVRELVKSDEYQAIMDDDWYDGTERKFMAAGFLAEETGDWKSAARYYLIASWYMAERGSSDRQRTQEMAAECYDKYLNDHVDISAALTFTDLLRQTGQMETAAKSAEFLYGYVNEEDSIRPFIGKELEWIKDGDTAPHNMDEV